MKLHFHRWDYFTDWQRDDTLRGGCVVHAQFRRCYTCGRWEREDWNWDYNSWDHCLEPIGVEKLNTKKFAEREMEEIRLRHSRYTVIDGH